MLRDRLRQAWENHTKIAQQLRDLTVPLDADFLQHTPFHAATPAELIRFTTYPALPVDPSFTFRCAPALRVDCRWVSVPTAVGSRRAA